VFHTILTLLIYDVFSSIFIIIFLEILIVSSILKGCLYSTFIPQILVLFIGSPINEGSFANIVIGISGFVFLITLLSGSEFSEIYM